MAEELSPEVIAIRAKRAAKLAGGPVVAEAQPAPTPKRPEPKPKAVVKAKKKSK